MSEKLTPSEQARVDAGKVNAAREREALKNTGPVSKTTNVETGKVTTTPVPADEPQRIGNFDVDEAVAENKQS